MHPRLASKPYAEVKLSDLKPILDQVAIKLLDKTHSPGRFLILPKGEESECRYATVLAVGQGQRSPERDELYPLEIQPGQTIITMGWCGAEGKVGLDKFRVIKNEHIWATCDFDGSKVENLKPYGDRLLVRLQLQDVSAGGILLTENQQRWETTTGEILKVGPGEVHLPSGRRFTIPAKVGEKWFIMRYAGAEVRIGEEKLRLVQEQDLLAKIEEN